MSFFDSFIGGAAEAGAGIIGSNMKAEQDKVKADQEFERQKFITQMNSDLLLSRERVVRTLASELSNKPLNDYATAVAGRMKDTVPMEPPAPVTQTSGITDRSTMTGADGNPIQSAGAGDVGLRGNIAALTKQIQNDPNMSEDDKRGALAQLNAQAAQQNQANADAAPKNRKVTREEATDLAMNDLLQSGNGAAYAAGRPLQVDKTLSVPDGGAIIDPRTGKVLFQNTGKADRQMEHEDFQSGQQQNQFAQQEKLKRMELDPLGINAAAGGGATGAAQRSIGSNLSGEEFLGSISKPVAEQVKALADGRLSFPSGAALKSPYWQSMLTLTAQYDPSFDAVNYGSRAATRKDFTSGKASQSVNALNTVLGHLDSLSDAADKLNNGSSPILNTASNFLENQIGDARVKKFEATKKAVVDELTRAWRGSGGSEGDIKTWSSTLDASNSPEQLHGVIGQLGELLESKIGALNDQYTKGMGTAGGGLNLLSPKSAEVAKRLRQRAGMDTDSPSGGQQPNGMLTYDPATGGFH